MRKLNDMLNQRIEKQIPSVDAPLMAFTAEGGVEPKGERYDRSYLVKNEDKLYKRTEYNDFIYSSNNLDVGSIGLNRYGTAVISDVYEIFSVKSDYLPTFVSELIQRPQNMKKVLKYRQGCLYGQYRIYAEDFLSVPVFVPTKQEQEKISQFLDSLDKRIAYQRSLINNLKKYKRGLSDELFGKNETSEEWTTVPFDEAFDLLQNNTFSRDEMSDESGIAYNIHYGDVLIKYGVVVDLSKSKVPYIRSDVSLSKYAQSSYLRDGDIVIADTAEDYTVGKAVEIVGVADAKALSGLHTIPCRPNISFAPMYLGYFINSKRFRTQILPLVQGTKVSSISKSEILKTSISFPSFRVQSQIASMLYALDHRIDICQACVQGLVCTKEALLQQLLI